jgi:cytoskeletal protein RodZ
VAALAICWVIHTVDMGPSDERVSMDAERLGQQLRTAREARELTLEQVEQALRIRAKFLGAFEAGAYEDLPGAVQARGFLRNYVRFLSLDEESILAQFDDIQAANASRRPRAARPAQTILDTSTIPVVPDDAVRPGAGANRGRGVRVMLAAVVGIVALVAVCLGGVIVVERVLNTEAGIDGPNLQSILPTVPSLTPSSTFLPSSTPLPGQSLPVDATPITGRVVLDVEVVQRTYMRVSVDGTQVFEGLVRPGTQLQYRAQQALGLEASNAAGLEVVFNNLPLGALGARGEALSTTFTPDMVLTPTAVPQPSATPAPLPGAEVDVPVDVTPGDAGDSGKAGQGAATPAEAPTSLPLPDSAAGVTGGTTPTALPAITDPDTSAVTTTLPPTDALATATTTPSATPSPTVTTSPTATVTPSPTAILPPRITSTPIPEK